MVGKISRGLIVGVLEEYTMAVDVSIVVALDSDVIVGFIWAVVLRVGNAGSGDFSIEGTSVKFAFCWPFRMQPARVRQNTIKIHAKSFDFKEIISHLNLISLKKNPIPAPGNPLELFIQLSLVPPMSAGRMGRRPIALLACPTQFSAS